MEGVKDTDNEGKGKRGEMEIIAVFPPTCFLSAIQNNVCLDFRNTTIH